MRETAGTYRARPQRARAWRTDAAIFSSATTRWCLDLHHDPLPRESTVRAESDNEDRYGAPLHLGACRILSEPSHRLLRTGRGKRKARRSDLRTGTEHASSESRPTAEGFNRDVGGKSGGLRLAPQPPASPARARVVKRIIRPRGGNTSGAHRDVRGTGSARYRTGRPRGEEERVALSLVIALRVVVRLELGQGPSEGSLAEQDELREDFSLGGLNPALRERIRHRCRMHPIRSVSSDVSG